MRPHEFLETDLIRKNFPNRNRVTKQLSALRKHDESIFPAGRKGSAVHVTATEAASLILLLSTNPNPFNQSEFQSTINTIEILKNFLNDLSLIFNCGGTHLNGQEVDTVFISLDNPFGRINFTGHLFNEYGLVKKNQAVERFAIITRDTMQEISDLINNTPRQGSTEERKDFIENITNTKL